MQDINKLRFVKRKNHLYVLMQANMTSEKEMQSIKQIKDTIWTEENDL